MVTREEFDDLIRKAMSGDVEAMREVILYMRPRIQRMAANEPSPDDATQAALIALWKSFNKSSQKHDDNFGDGGGFDER